MKHRFIVPVLVATAVLTTTTAPALALSGPDSPRLPTAHPRTAHTSGTATGSYSFVSDNSVEKGTGGGDTYSLYLSQGTYTGGLSGTYLDSGTLVAHKNGTETAWGTEYCANCVLGGKLGGYKATFYFTGGRSSATVNGTVVFSQGYGGLAGLTGGGTFETNAGGTHYSYAYKD